MVPPIWPDGNCGGTWKLDWVSRGRRRSQLAPNLASAIRRAHALAPEPSDDSGPVIVERQRHRHDNGGEQDDVKIVARRGVGALRGQDPGARDAAEGGDEGKDPERHRTQTKEVADHVLGQPRNQEDDETEDGALRFHDEAHLLPDLRADQLPNVMSAQPPPDAEGRHGPEGEADRRVEEPDPLPEQIAAKDPRHLAGDGRNDDLQGLEADEDDGRQDPPLPQRLLEKPFVHVEPDKELVGGSVRQDEPRTVPDEGGGDRPADDPLDSRLHRSSSRMVNSPDTGEQTLPPLRKRASRRARSRRWHECGDASPEYPAVPGGHVGRHSRVRRPRNGWSLRCRLRAPLDPARTGRGRTWITPERPSGASTGT